MKPKKHFKICIRDDDLCYYSNFSDFKHIYDELDIPVSISLIPNGVANHGTDMPYGNDKPINTPRFFYENNELVLGLKQGIENKKYEILLHGFDHSYVKDGCGNYIGEMLWKDRKQLEKDIKQGKEIIEQHLGVMIDTFVAPSQEINQKGIDVISNLRMNYSGQANKYRERKINFTSFIAISKRYISRLIYGISFSSIISYKTHKEQSVIGLPNDFCILVKYYNICKKHHWNMVIVTHYWELLSDKNKYNVLKNFILFAKTDNSTFSFVGELFH